jgi:dGTPase
VVDILEKRYELFEGLNLTYETREGIIKHSSDYDHPDCRNFNPHEQPSIEAQLIDLADEIAYNNHDLDDGISSGLLDIAEAEELAIWKLSGAPSGLTSMKREELKLAVRSGVRSIINMLATDLIRTTSENISALKIESLEDARSCGRKVSGFSDEVKKCNNGLKLFLRERLYRHYRVARMTIKAENVIRELFDIYTKHPETLPDAYRERAETSGIIRTVTDYIAGMTDRYALEEQKKLTDPSVKS